MQKLGIRSQKPIFWMSFSNFPLPTLWNSIEYFLSPRDAIKASSSNVFIKSESGWSHYLFSLQRAKAELLLTLPHQLWSQAPTLLLPWPVGSLHQNCPLFKAFLVLHLMLLINQLGGHQKEWLLPLPRVHTGSCFKQKRKLLEFQRDFENECEDLWSNDGSYLQALFSPLTFLLHVLARTVDHMRKLGTVHVFWKAAVLQTHQLWNAKCRHWCKFPQKIRNEDMVKWVGIFFFNRVTTHLDLKPQSLSS